MAGHSEGHFVRRTLKLMNNLLKSEGTIFKISYPDFFQYVSQFGQVQVELETQVGKFHIPGWRS